MKRRGIAFRLAASILGGVLLIMAVVIGYTYQTMREGIVATARKGKRPNWRGPRPTTSKRCSPRPPKWPGPGP